MCSYPQCPKLGDALVSGERRYHAAPCKLGAKRLSDRDRRASKYGEGKIGRCANTRNGVHSDRALIWSRTHPIGSDSYLWREAILCGERCLIEWYDDRPELAKPEAYWLAKDIPLSERPVALERISTTPVGDAELLDWLSHGSGHRHKPNRQCAGCING